MCTCELPHLVSTRKWELNIHTTSFGLHTDKLKAHYRAGNVSARQSLALVSIRCCMPCFPASKLAKLYCDTVILRRLHNEPVMGHLAWLESAEGGSLLESIRRFRLINSPA